MRPHQTLSFVALMITLYMPQLHAQTFFNKGIGTSSPDSSAVLDVYSSDKGMLLPRLTTTQRMNIPNPATGLLVFDSDLFGFWFFDGTQWLPLGGSGVPIGTVVAFAGSTAPSGWLLCDGSYYLPSQYPALFNVIGYTYDGVGGLFAVPELKGRILAGTDTSDIQFDTPGKIGGSKTHTISASEIPTHNHTASMSSDGTHQHSGTASTDGNHQHTGVPLTLGTSEGGNGDLEWRVGGITDPAGDHTHNLSISNAGQHNHSITVNPSIGGGLPFPIVQPYLVMNYIINPTWPPQQRKTPKFHTFSV